MWVAGIADEDGRRARQRRLSALPALISVVDVVYQLHGLQGFIAIANLDREIIGNEIREFEDFIAPGIVANVRLRRLLGISLILVISVNYRQLLLPIGLRARENPGQDQRSLRQKDLQGESV